MVTAGDVAAARARAVDARDKMMRAIRAYNAADRALVEARAEAAGLKLGASRVVDPDGRQFLLESGILDERCDLVCFTGRPFRADGNLAAVAPWRLTSPRPAPDDGAL